MRAPDAERLSTAGYRAAALVVDLDNTLYSFDVAYASAIRALVYELARLTHSEDAAIYACVRQILLERGTLEYSRLIPELVALYSSNVPQDATRAITLAGERAFRGAYMQDLSLFPGVRDTLRWARHSGLMVIAWTDAPRPAAEARIRHFSIDGFFDALFAWRGLPGDAAHSPRLTSSRLRGVCVDLPDDYRKPNPQGLQHALHKMKLTPRQAVVVGDNVHRDIAAANAAGALSVWARYGAEFDLQTRQTIELIFPRSPTAGRVLPSDSGSSTVPARVIDRFSDVRDCFRGSAGAPRRVLMQRLSMPPSKRARP